MNLTNSFTDHPIAVRSREQPDLVKLVGYLQANIPGLSGFQGIEQFPAGFSNLTYLLRFTDRELVVRRPPVGAKIKTAHDMGREYKILKHLRTVYDRVPEALLYCDEPSIMGAPFYVMERVRGVILRAHLPAGLKLTPTQTRKLSESFVCTLAQIHSLDYSAAGLTNLGTPAGYVGRQVNGWIGRYRDSQTDDVAAIDGLSQWLQENMPVESTTGALIHNDFKFDNLVLSERDLTQVIAVLDWEMATIGDPLMDLGTTLGYWVERSDTREWQQYGFVLTALPGHFDRLELIEFYQHMTGLTVAHRVFYYAYGLLKIAVIVQQIYARFRKGLTADERFAHLDRLVDACGKQALRAIELNRINALN